MTSICVFCGSSPGRNPDHMALAQATGRLIAQRGNRLVYGGGGLGLMGALARAAHNEGGDVLGIIPELLAEVEKTFTDISYRIVTNIQARKMMMFDESDAFIVLPGGIGTLEEAIDVLSWMRLNIHAKPLVFLDNTDYWTPLIKTMKDFITEGFAPETLALDLHQASTPELALGIIDKEMAAPRERAPLNLKARPESQA